MSDDPVVRFVYLLLQDYVTFGDLEEIILDIDGHDTYALNQDTVLEYAEDYVQRLQSKYDG